MKLQRLVLFIASAGLLTLYGCGGGDSSSPAPAPVPVPVITTTDVAITVVDGPIQNATVCLDINGNGLCDAGEPSAKTDATGKVTLTVEKADAGKYAVLAVVGTDAVDADTGKVPVPFTLSAPADAVAVVSPLTTLVQQTIASTGASTADAAAAVQATTGITVSLFQDFTKVAAPSDGSMSAATVARMVVVTTQQQTTALGSGVVGSAATGGAKITQADLDSVIQKKLLELLPDLVTALRDPAVQAAATPKAKEDLLAAAATTLVSSSGLTAAAMPTLVAINTQAASTSPVPAVTPVASANLPSLSFNSASSWALRVMTSTALENTPAADGSVKYRELHSAQSFGGSPSSWGHGSSANRGSDLHWNGTAWAACAINSENTSIRDAKGHSTYNYCDKLETGTSNRATFDVAGRKMIDVYNEIVAAGYTNLSITAADTVLGAATFPTGSNLIYQNSAALTAAMGYYPGTGNLLTQYSAAVSAGGVASTQAATAGCNSTEWKTSSVTNSTTLESMIASMTGTPCVFGQGSFKYQAAGSATSTTYTSPDAADEAWANSTVGIATIGTAPVGTGLAPGFYSGNTKLRVAFKGTGANPVTYYACKERFNTGAARNCTVIGTGSYTIASLGDARVLTLNNTPVQMAPLSYAKVFVERGGLVYSGYQNKPFVYNSARLDLTGLNALFSQLGLPAVDASTDTPVVLSQASYAGNYSGSFSGSDSGTFSVSLNPAGISTCSGTSALKGAFTCSMTLTPSSSKPTQASISLGVAATGAVFSSAVDFTTGIVSGTWVNGLASGTLTGNRL